MKHPESKEKNQADNYVGWKKPWHKMGCIDGRNSSVGII